MKKKINEVKICIPQGFFGGNCAGCQYWEDDNKRFDGRAYCSYYEDWFYPSEMHSCQLWEGRGLYGVLAYSQI